MISCGLSEEEFEKIKLILSQDGISYAAGMDEEMLKNNNESLNSYTKYLRPPDITTNFLVLVIDDADFQKLSTSAKEELLFFGITDISPNLEEFSTIDSGQNKPRKQGFTHIVGTTLLFIICVFFICNWSLLLSIKIKA